MYDGHNRSVYCTSNEYIIKYWCYVVIMSKSENVGFFFNFMCSIIN